MACQRPVGHLLLAACTRDHAEVRALETALRAARDDPTETRVGRLSVLDLDAGPRIGRVKAAIGLGWHARDRLRAVREATGQAVDAVVEVCVCGRHHLLGLGRSHIAAVRWRPVTAGQRGWLDSLASAEGAEVILDGGALAHHGAASVVARLLAALEAARRPRTPVPGPDPGKA